MKNKIKQSLQLNWNWWIFLVLSVVILRFALNNSDYLGSQNISYSSFIDLLNKSEVKSVTIEERHLKGELIPGEDQKKRFFSVYLPPEDKIIDRLLAKKIEIKVAESNSWLGIVLSWVLPMGLFLMIWSLISRQMGGPPQSLLSMTKSKAKTNIEVGIKTTFMDVAGIDEAKEELFEIVSFLQNPKRYSRLGGRSPKGVLLVGPPGTGKTLLARAVAGEAKVPFYSINGSEFVEMFVGLGAARVRDLFEQARKSAPCILFIDEIDALGKSRTLGVIGSGSSDEKEQTLNQLLAEMDGFDSSEGVIILAATNRPEILDPALLRAGRFDRQILLSNPDFQGRVQILKVHVKRIKLAANVDLNKLAAMTSGFSGADLANLVNEAAIVATRRDAEAVLELDFSEAIERIVAGLQKKTKFMIPSEKARVAYHELGHATVALALCIPDRVQKISIIPRGMGALGYTLQRPIEDRYLLSERELNQKIAVLLGGRAAEEIFFEEGSTGAADDLAKATEIARAMVTQFGMSGSVGLMSVELKKSQFITGLGDRLSEKVSEATNRDIDLEVKALLEKGLRVAKDSIRSHLPFVQSAATELLRIETLDEARISELWREPKIETGEIHV